jgi:ABC-type transport system involved in multi-copper enzyme maturation permease subunit
VALTIYVPVIEWYQETDLMLLSLPVRRDTVVLARYLVAMVAGVVAGLAWTAAGRLLLPMLDAGRDTPAMWVTLSGGLTFFIAFGLLASFLLPLYFRLGVGKGALAFLGLSVVLLALSYGTAGLAGGPVPSGPVGLIPPSALISARVTAMLGSLGPAGTLTVVLVGIALVYGVSLKVSQRWFAGREF